MARLRNELNTLSSAIRVEPELWHTHSSHMSDASKRYFDGTIVTDIWGKALPEFCIVGKCSFY